VAAYERGGGRRGARDLRRAAALDPSIGIHAEAARDAATSMHPLLLPLWPIYRFGQGPVWLGGVAVLLGLRALDVPGTIALVVVVIWLAFVAYSWIAPPLLERWLRRRL
jgi:hypothetical protein